MDGLAFRSALGGAVLPILGENQRVVQVAGNASYPYRSHDLWFITENMRWGQRPASTDAKAPIAAVTREDIWRAAAKSHGLPAPEGTSRGIETFFDGIKFDPETPEKYLVSQKIKVG